MRQVLVAYDFSLFSRRALALAMQGYPFGVGPDSVVKVVHVIDERLYENVLSKEAVPDEDEIVSYLKDDVAQVKADIPAEADVVCEPVIAVLRGKPYEQILKTTGEHRAAALMVGGQGHGGVKEFFIGRTAQRLLRHTTCPVYVVRDPQPRPLPDHLLCAVDGSEVSAHALIETAKLSESLSTPFSTIQVNENPYIPYIQRVAWEIHDENALEEMRVHGLKELKEFEKKHLGGLKARNHLYVFGDVVETLDHHAAVLGAGTIVVGVRGHGAIERATLGSVAEGLVRKAEVDVLIVH